MCNYIFVVINENGISMTVIATNAEHVRELVTAYGHNAEEIREIGKAHSSSVVGVIE